MTNHSFIQLSFIQEVLTANSAWTGVDPKNSFLPAEPGNPLVTHKEIKTTIWKQPSDTMSVPVAKSLSLYPSICAYEFLKGPHLEIPKIILSLHFCF